MAMNGTTATTLAGTIATVNSRGVQLRGSSDWINFSKYAAEDALGAPRVGDRVELDDVPHATWLAVAGILAVWRRPSGTWLRLADGSLIRTQETPAELLERISEARR
jgi:hypothetical protein